MIFFYRIVLFIVFGGAVSFCRGDAVHASPASRVSAASHASCTGSGELFLENPPDRLSATQVFEDLSTLKPCSNLVEYEVNSPLWSDGAVKRRWVLLPKNGKIEFSPDNPWVYPPGTVFIKQFDLRIGPAEIVRVETRFLVSHPDGKWSGYTYRWEDAREGEQKDAHLLSGAEEATFQITLPDSPGSPSLNTAIQAPSSNPSSNSSSNPSSNSSSNSSSNPSSNSSSNSSSTQVQRWAFPSRPMCMQCHNSWSGFILGARQEQLNQMRDSDGSTSNQLQSWENRNFFSKKLELRDDDSKFVKISDVSQPLEKRVRSYLAVNCSECHQPGSVVRSGVDLRYKTPLAQTHMINSLANLADMDLENPLIVNPGDKNSSVLWLRMKTRGTRHMPLLGSNVPDDQAIDLVGEWIDGMPATSLKD